VIESVSVQGNTVKIEVALDGPEPRDDEPEATDDTDQDGPSILGVAGAVVVGAAKVVGAVYDAIKPESDDE
jgi:hypothetical protein